MEKGRAVNRCVESWVVVRATARERAGIVSCLDVGVREAELMMVISQGVERAMVEVVRRLK